MFQKLLFVMLFLALLVGCSRADHNDGPPMILTKVTFSDGTPADLRPVKLDLNESKTKLYSALERAGYIQGEANRSDWRVSIDGQMIYGFTTGEGLEASIPESASAQVVLSLELKLKAPNESEAIYFLIQGNASEAIPLSQEYPEKRLKTELDQALSQVESSLRARRNVFERDVQGLLKALKDPEPEIRLAAADRLGMLRDQESVLPIAERLSLENERDVLLRLIGALSEIGDERAAPALISLADPYDLEMLRPILDALSVIGGSRVSDFFDILEHHDSVAVREMLLEARKRLVRAQFDAGL